MFKQLASNLYLVHNGRELNEVLDARMPETPKPDNYIPDPLELMYPNRLEVMADYPVVVSFSDRLNHEIIPVMKAIGSLGPIHLIDMKNIYEQYERACKDKSLTAAPKIMLTSVTITQRGKEPTENVGMIAHVHDRGLNINELFNLATKSAPQSITIEFNNDRKAPAVRRNPGSCLFRASERDITDLIVSVIHDKHWDQYRPTYVFNHYDFMQAIPEIKDYLDTNVYKLDFRAVVTSTLDANKRFGETWR